MMAQGKDTIDRSSASDRTKSMLDRMGIKGDKISRSQFTKAMEERMKQFGGGRPGGDRGGSDRGGSDRGGSDRGRGDDRGRGGDEKMSDDQIKERAKSFFDRRDRNRDGSLDKEEMSSSMRDDLGKWDKNRDGKVSFDEYTPYIKSYYERRSQGRSSDRGRSEKKPAELPTITRPTVYYFGNLPENLPGWFSEFDTDRDGQLGLYEWRTSGKELNEFAGYDKNSDGLVTPEEMLVVMLSDDNQSNSESSRESSRGFRRR